MLEKSLAGLNALVTGSGRGIGKEIALALGKKGANFSVHSLHSTDGAFETIDAVLHERVHAIRNAGCWSSDCLPHRKGRSYASHLFVGEGPRAVRQGERCGTR